MKVVPIIAFVVMAVLMFLLHAAVANVRPLALTVRPQVSFAPAQLAIQIRVQAIDSDRWINVVIDDGDYRRSSGFTIEPDRTLYLVNWHDIPQGEYVVFASLGTGDQARATDRATVLVQGR